MIGAGLSPDQGPPISVPTRFFLTAPLFGAAAALCLFYLGPAALSSRWTAAAVGITHLLVLGYLGMVMVGALFQMLPVLAGTPYPHALPIATVVHMALTLGIAFFGGGLIANQAHLFGPAAVLLGLGFLLFIVVFAVTLAKAIRVNSTVWAMRMAGAALAITILAGLWLAALRAGFLNTLPWPLLPNVHLAWGMLGWVLLLIAGVAYQLVPMFQITPAYPAWMTRWLLPMLFTALLALSLNMLFSQIPLLGKALEVTLAGGLTLFALTTLRLQARRRRRLADVTLWYWRAGMYSLLVCCGVWLSGMLWPSLTYYPVFAPIMATIFILGFAQSVINGMLYKIVPFLVWFHLQSQGITSVPTMKSALPEKPTRLQFVAHVTATIGLVLALLMPRWLHAPAALAYAVSCLMLWENLAGALLIYYREHRSRNS